MVITVVTVRSYLIFRDRLFSLYPRIKRYTVLVKTGDEFHKYNIRYRSHPSLLHVTARQTEGGGRPRIDPATCARGIRSEISSVQANRFRDGVGVRCTVFARLANDPVFQWTRGRSIIVDDNVDYTASRDIILLLLLCSECVL